MDVVEGIDELREVTTRLGGELELEFVPASEASVDEVAARLPISVELRRALRHGAPSGELPPFVQWSTLAPLDELVAGQDGYAWLRSGEPIAGWDPGWVVIGQEAGDPFIAHVDRPGTPVSVALHGTGSWNPLPIASSLGAFYALMARWSQLTIGDGDDDEDSRTSSFWATFERVCDPVVSADEVANLRRWLGE